MLRQYTASITAIVLSGVLAALYLLIALLSLFLLPTPFGLPLIWLPAGFAAASMIALGWRKTWVGIMLGGFCAPLILNSTNWNSDALPIALGAGISAVLQTLIVLYCQRHWPIISPAG